VRNVAKTDGVILLWPLTYRMDAFTPLQFGFDSIAGAVLAAGTVVLMLMLVGMGVFAYKNLRGDGIDWPDDTDGGPDGFRAEERGSGTSAANGLEKGDEDDEWDYY